MKTVLLVEDESTFQIIGKVLLRSIGLPMENFYSAQSGIEALALIDKLQAENKPLPDLILLDLYMPEMDGFGFLEAFSKNDYHGKDTIEIIVLTSSHNTGDIKRIQEFGARYMTKPLEEANMRLELGL